MVLEIEKPKVTEIQVRMDCNGCVQKIKKALNGINGIYNFYIDFPQQKITIIGWTELEKIVKAITKTRKIVTICSHSEATDPPALAPEPAPNAGAPPQQPPPPPPPPPPLPPQPDAGSPSAEAPPAEAHPPQAEPPKDQPPPPPANPSPVAATSDTKPSQPPHPLGPKDREEVHVVHHRPLDYGNRFAYGPAYGPANSAGYGRHWSSQPHPNFRHDRPEPVYVTHGYNMYRPSPYITEYEYAPAPLRYTSYNRMDQYYDGDYQNGSRYCSGNISSMFSDENPNACTIV